MIDDLWKEFGEIPIGSPTIQQRINDLKVIEYKWIWKLSKDNSIKFFSPDAPCWAHRLIQRVILGIIWEKL